MGTFSSGADLLSTGRSRRKPKRYRPIVFLTLIFILASSAIFVGCSSEEVPSNTEYPLTVSDSLGRSVQLTEVPLRIVTAHPTATETLCCAGGMPVGVDSSCKYPLEVEGLPTFGSAFNLNVEAIAGLEPDLIIIEGLTQARFLGALAPLAVPIVAVKATSMDEVIDSVKMVGEIIDKNEEAASAVNHIRDRIEAAQSNFAAEKSVLFLIADESNVYAATKNSYPGNIADLLGLTNLAADMLETGPYPGFAVLSQEEAANMDPDIIFTITPMPGAPKLSTMLGTMPAFQNMEATTKGSIVELDCVLYLQAQGPRIADAVEGLPEIIETYA